MGIDIFQERGDGLGVLGFFFINVAAAVAVAVDIGQKLMNQRFF